MAAVFALAMGLSRADAATPAGTVIDNAASATFVDPTAPGTIYQANSNTVAIVVAEVAGITNVPLAVTTAGGGPIIPGSSVDFDFTVTNTGNNTNGFSLPNAATVSGTAAATPAANLLVSYNGGTTFTAFPAAAGTFAGGRLQTTPIVAGGSVIVRVVVAVPAGATQSQTIIVQYGNTAPNDNTAGTQNQAYNAAHAGNVYTTNNASTPSPGPPLNGMREASALEQSSVMAKPQTFPVLLKSGAVATPNVNPALTTIQYSLTLNVLTSYPAAGVGYLPEPLVATTMQLNGAPAQRVLVSDVIPALTVLTSVSAPPAGWTVVYSTDSTNTATAAAFTTTAPANLATVKRIGWVAAGPIALGSSTPGFAFLATSSGAPPNVTSTILNLAQVFGQSQNDPTNTLVFDNSGDPYPADFSAGNGAPGSSTPLGTLPGSGVAPPAGPNDPGNNTGPAGGANNVVMVSPQTALLNGPNGAAGAVGPDGSNETDVTIQSVTVPVGLAPTAPIPVPLQTTFANTIGNNGSIPLLNVTLVPQSPASAGALPDGTTVALTPAGGTTVVYTYHAVGGWTLTSGTPISIASIPVSGVANYTTVVTLPAGTPQSIGTAAAAGGYPVPLLATSTTAFGTSSNLTTDTVYTGFLKLTKTAQVFNANGTPCDLAPTATPNPACVVTGNFVVYVIAYSNIVPANLGSGSVGPSAHALVITEDGLAAGNTFAALINGVMATSNVQGTAADSTAGNAIAYYNGVGQNVGDIVGTGTLTGDVAKYVDTFAAPLGPGASGTFSFRRKIN